MHFRFNFQTARDDSGGEPSYVDGPYWQAFFDVSNDLVCFGHMSGLLVRVYDRWP
jgi:hypothetical protein